MLTVVGLPLLTAVLAAPGGTPHAGDGPAPLPGRHRRHRRPRRVLVGTVAAVVASLLVNWFFVEPIHTLTVSDPENVVAIAIFVTAAIGASVMVDRIRRRSQEAFQAWAEAGALARTSGILIGASDPLPELLDQLRTTFALQSVSLLSNRDDGWVLDASAGDRSSDRSVPRRSVGPRRGRYERRRPARSAAVGRRSTGAAHVPRTWRWPWSPGGCSRRPRWRRTWPRPISCGPRCSRSSATTSARWLASIKASASSLLQSHVGWDAEQLRAFARRRSIRRPTASTTWSVISST